MLFTHIKHFYFKILNKLSLCTILPMTSFRIILAYTESILGKQVNLLSKHLGKPKFFNEIAKIELRLYSNKIDSDIRQNDNSKIMSSLFI
jgi:hypothetical protein